MSSSCRRGRVHAIGAGCFIAEIQQTSDITYRIYDYNRKDAAGNPPASCIQKWLKTLSTTTFTALIKQITGKKQTILLSWYHLLSSPQNCWI